MAVGAVSRFLAVLWGPELASHVVGTYVVRAIDALFAVPWAIIRGLFGGGRSRGTHDG